MGNLIFDTPEGQDNNPELEGRVEEVDESGEPQDAEPAPVQDGATEPQTPDDGEFYDFRWRQDQYRIPRRVVSEFAKSINAPSEEAIINWAQVGRDVDHHRQELRRHEATLQEQARALQAYEARLMASRRTGPAGGYPQRERQPVRENAPGQYRMPDSIDPNNPAQVLQALAALPHVLREMQTEFRQGIGAVQGSFQSREQHAVYERELATVQSEATRFLEQLKTEGWVLPEGFDEESMISECNRLGLSADPTLTWPEAFEIVAARRLYRHAYRRGMADVVKNLQTDRKSEVRVPAARQAASSRVESPTGNTLQARAEAALKMGRSMTVGEALGER